MPSLRPSPSPADRFEVYARHVEARAALYARPWHDAAVAAEQALSPADRDLVRRARALASDDSYLSRGADGFVSFEVA